MYALPRLRFLNSESRTHGARRHDSASSVSLLNRCEPYWISGGRVRGILVCWCDRSSVALFKVLFVAWSINSIFTNGYELIPRDQNPLGRISERVPNTSINQPYARWDSESTERNEGPVNRNL